VFQSFKVFANMTILKVTGWMKTLDIPFRLINAQSLRAHEGFKTLCLRALAGISSRAPKSLLLNKAYSLRICSKCYSHFYI